MFLDEILQYKYAEVSIRKELTTMAELEKKLKDCPETRDFKESLTRKTISIIAEVKKASPSKGLLCPNFEPVKLARIYEAAGAAAVSVLTEEKFFQGSLEYLRMVKAETKSVPILRKDFIIDLYQLYEARVYGADAVLLIVAALSELELTKFIREAKELKLAPLVEVHDQNELYTALNAGADLIGINNRNLKTFAVDLKTTFQLLDAIPKGKVVVSESGIKNVNHIKSLSQAGINAALIGELLVTVDDPGAKIKELLGAAV